MKIHLVGIRNCPRKEETRIAMVCPTTFPSMDNVSDNFAIFIRIYNAIIGFLNITGNAFLIYGLKRTGQTRMISFQYIILMSTCDIIVGFNGLIFGTIYTLNSFSQYCWLAICNEFIATSCSGFSVTMIGLIALDRYLHMKFLQRYSTLFTVKRGRILALVVFLVPLCFTAIRVMSIPKATKSIVVLIHSIFPSVILVSIIILYRNACKEMERKANPAIRSLATENRTLAKAARRITICYVCLILPLSILCIIVSCQEEEDSSYWKIPLILAYVTYLCNGFCSSCIFISLNKPIQLLIRRIINLHLNRVRDTTGNAGSTH